ncbi:MAG: dethiobiotin synthase [Gammaproteobacteria bacterium]
MSVFITGTDTGCGKTFVSATLLERLNRRGLRTLGMKPVATGATRGAGRLINDDVDTLDRASSISAPATARNPYLFEPPCSPHIAAAHAGTTIELPAILAAFDDCQRRADIVVVEGVGGWLVPLSDQVSVADLARALHLPVVLVVAVRLGCINHALLTASAIAATGVEFMGWLANVIEADLYAPSAVIETLERRIPAPLLGKLDRHDCSALDDLAQMVVAANAS